MILYFYLFFISVYWLFYFFKMLTSYSNNQLLYYHFQNYRPKTLMCLLIYCWFCVFLILEFACNVKSDACYLKIDACYVKSDACYVKWCACYVNNSLLPKYLYDILFEGVGGCLRGGNNAGKVTLPFKNWQINRQGVFLALWA